MFSTEIDQNNCVMEDNFNELLVKSELSLFISIAEQNTAHWMTCWNLLTQLAQFLEKNLAVNYDRKFAVTFLFTVC